MSDNVAPLILLTRPRAASERFRDVLQGEFGAAARIVVAPLMQITPRAPMPDLTYLSGVVFTSETAVQVLGPVAGAASITAWCVGDRTAEAAKRAGFDARSAQGTADDLVEMIKAARPSGPLLHLHGRHTRGNVVGRLRGAGLSVDAKVIYDQTATDVPDMFTAALADPGPVLVPLFSPRSARLFAAAAGPRRNRNVTLIAMSGAVEDDLPEDWKPACRLAPDPSGPAMIGALRKGISL